MANGGNRMIFLSILKIIGIVLLCLLLFILLIILAVLFVPIRYKVKGSHYDEMNLSGNVSWFFHFISIRFGYDSDKKITVLGRILGIRIFPKKHKKKSIDNSSMKKKKEKKTETKKHIRDSKSEKQISESENVDFSDTDASDNKFSIKKWFLKIKEKIKDKYKKIKRFIKKWKRIITDEHNHNAVRFLKDKFIHLLKVIMPKKMFLKADFSLGEPDKTALVLGVVSMFPIGYQNKWQIHPDFEAEEAYFKGEGYAKGKICVYKLLFIALSVFMNKECKRLYRMINKK